MGHENASYVSVRVPRKGPFTHVTNPHITLAYYKDTSPEQLADALPEKMGHGPTTLEMTGAGIWRGQMMGRPPYWIVYASMDCAARGKYLRDLRQDIVLDAEEYGLEVDTSYDFVPHVTVWTSEDVAEARQRLPLMDGRWRFTVDTLHISRPGQPDYALTVQL